MSTENNEQTTTPEEKTLSLSVVPQERISEDIKKMLNDLIKRRLDKRILRLEHRHDEGSKNLKYVYKYFKTFDQQLESIVKNMEDTLKKKESKKMEESSRKTKKNITSKHPKSSKSVPPKKKLGINKQNFNTQGNNERKKLNINSISNFHTEINEKDSDKRTKSLKEKRMFSETNIKKGKTKLVKKVVASPSLKEDIKAKTLPNYHNEKKSNSKKELSSTMPNKSKTRDKDKKNIKKNTELAKTFSETNINDKNKKPKEKEIKSEKKEKNFISHLTNKKEFKINKKEKPEKKDKKIENNINKKESPKKETKKEPPKKEKTKIEEPKKEETKEEEVKKEETKVEEPKKEEEKKEETKIDESKKEEEVKNEETKIEEQVKNEIKEEKPVEEKKEEKKEEPISEEKPKEENNINEKEPPKEEPKLSSEEKKDEPPKTEESSIPQEEKVASSTEQKEENNIISDKEEIKSEPKKEEPPSQETTEQKKENEETKKEEKINDNQAEGNTDKLIEELKKDYIEKVKAEMTTNFDMHNVTLNPMLNQSLNSSMSFSQSFLLSKSMVDEDNKPKLPPRDPNKPLTMDEIIKDYKNAFIYVLDFLNLQERIEFTGVHRGFKAERAYLFNLKREEIISSLELKDRETLDDRIVQFKLKHSQKALSEPFGEFSVSKASSKTVILLDNTLYSKLFKTPILDDNLADIYIIYRLLFVLFGEHEIADIMDDRLFWVKCTEYLITKSNGKIGTFIVEKSKNFDFSHKSIYLMNRLLVGIKPKIVPTTFTKVSGTTGLLFFLIKDSLEYCGVLINEKKTQPSRIYDNLIFYKKLIDTLAFYIDFLSKIKA